MTTDAPSSPKDIALIDNIPKPLPKAYVRAHQLIEHRPFAGVLVAAMLGWFMTPLLITRDWWSRFTAAYYPGAPQTALILQLMVLAFGLLVLLLAAIIVPSRLRYNRLRALDPEKKKIAFAVLKLVSDVGKFNQDLLKAQHLVGTDAEQSGSWVAVAEHFAAERDILLSDLGDAAEMPGVRELCGQT